MGNIISNEFLQPYLHKQPNWGFGDLSFVTYLRSYSRDIEENGKRRKECFAETIGGCINGAQAIGTEYTKEEAERLFKYMWQFKGLYAGRLLWQLGTKTVEKIGANSLLNCWFTKISSKEDFLFLFDNLMLGGGVGFGNRAEWIYKLPPIKKNVKIELKNTKDADFIVPDSRGGWVNLIGKVLKSYFVTGKSFNYSTMLVRGYGEPVKGFGGTSSGPLPLISGVENLCSILSKREGKQANSTDILDICNILSRIVDAGNLRRGAEICIGDINDVQYLKAKRWDLGLIPNWRAVSNNSIYCNDIEDLPQSFWDGYEEKGEPYGLINLPLGRKRGRLKDGYKSDNVDGVNPCAEIMLADKECCDLSEVFISKVESLEEFIDITQLLYKTNKAILSLPFLHEETSKIVKKNQRIGISVSGIYQILKTEKMDWLSPCYESLVAFDKEWSKKKNCNPSIKLTTVKPSGTISTLAGTTHGGHPAIYEIFYRTVRASSNDPIVKYCRERGYKIEYVENYDGSIDRNTAVIYFPIKLENAISANEVTAIDQLEMLKKLQTEWSDNAVSMTVYYKIEELSQIKEWLLKNYKNSVKSVSFLLHREHGFKQAPFQEITEEEYQKAIGSLKKVDINNFDFITGISNLVSDCSEGTCGLNDAIM